MLTPDSWALLSPDEQRGLLAHLPAGTAAADVPGILADVFRPQWQYGDAGPRLGPRARGGELAEVVAPFLRANRDLQYREYVHAVREYHDQMVASFVGLQEHFSTAEPFGGDVDKGLTVQGFIHGWLVMDKRMEGHRRRQKRPWDNGGEIGRAFHTPDAFGVAFGLNSDRLANFNSQRSLVTIPQSTPEAVAEFRRQESERYANPSVAYRYKVGDELVTVAPAQKTTKVLKARDHALLVPGRAPHITILSITRDATAQLPDVIGTRADVCQLARNSQFVVSSATTAQLNQVISSALDRLHYERDPCVKFDSTRKLWCYLHKDRSLEDFKKEGMLSLKPGRPKKGPCELENNEEQSRAKAAKRAGQKGAGGKRKKAKADEAAPGGDLAPAAGPFEGLAGVDMSNLGALRAFTPGAPPQAPAEEAGQSSHPGVAEAPQLAVAKAMLSAGGLSDALQLQAAQAAQTALGGQAADTQKILNQVLVAQQQSQQQSQLQLAMNQLQGVLPQPLVPGTNLAAAQLQQLQAQALVQQQQLQQAGGQSLQVQQQQQQQQQQQLLAQAAHNQLLLNRQGNNEDIQRRLQALIAQARGQNPPWEQQPPPQ